MKQILGILLLFVASSTVSIAEEINSYQTDTIADGQLEKAESALLAVVEKDPNDPFALLNLAYIYQKAGDQARAQQVYQRILAQKDNPYAELASGKLERVKTIAQRGIALTEGIDQ